MKNSQRLGFFIGFLIVTLLAACAPIKTVEVWKEQAYTQPLKSVLVIAITQQDNIREQFENVLSNHLAKHGVKAIPGYKVLPPYDKKPEREVVLATVKELGVEHVLVARSISRKEITNHQYGGVVLGGTAVYSGGDWYGYSYGESYSRQYDTDFFTVSTRLYDVTSQKLVWSYIAQVKVEGSRQGAVNVFVPTVIEQLQGSKLL
ncbi:MAG: hypothetical protein ACWGOL_01905 [Desulfuromonadales bacterium]